MSASSILSPEAMQQAVQKRAAYVNAWLGTCVSGDVPDRIPGGLRKAMEYSLMAGGKRLRPVLCLTCASLCGLDTQDRACILPFAGALEMVHTYSLIHDDLPAMDNDDLRRGKPTNHVVFGEANAILAGDALLTDAFAHMASVSLPPERVLPALARFAKAAGSCGMVGGQFLDMLHEGDATTNISLLQHIHALKTGAMITAACVCGGILAGADTTGLHALETYGACLGVAFQIHDDILDATGTAAELGKTPGKDAVTGKATYPWLVGLAQSRTLALEYAQRAVESLAIYTGEDAALLRALAQYAVTRTH